MAVQKTIQIGDPLLRVKNALVDDFDTIELRALVQDLTETMRSVGLIGIAAPQIACNFRVFITEPRPTQGRADTQSDELRIFINPTIIATSADESVIYEGCGSIAEAKLFGPVQRAKEVTIEAYDILGKKFRMRADGILGRVMLHEFDHLEGVLFTDKLTDPTKLMDIEYYRENIRNSTQQIEASKISLKDFNYI